MSGSSLDGLDVAIVRIGNDGSGFTHELLSATTIPYNEMWISRLKNLPSQSATSYIRTHTYFGHYISELIQPIIDSFEGKIDLIASHGHTIFHEPERNFTSQIGDGAAIAALTGISVVSDFRTQDVALGGEGAPVAPIVDTLLFSGYDFYLNIGGIANMTAAHGEYLAAFDICPANQILNEYAQRLGFPYDRDGNSAQSGNLNEDLFEALSKLDYYDKPHPKTLDNNQIREAYYPLIDFFNDSPENILHTFCVHIADQLFRSTSGIMDQWSLSKNQFQIMLSGGGAFNQFLVKQIRERMEGLNVEVVIPSDDIVNFKEAILMAFMGYLRVNGMSNCLGAATGASRDSIGGAMYFGNN